MAASPWELVNPIEEMIVPTTITINTIHRMPSAAWEGSKEDGEQWIMELSGISVEDRWIIVTPLRGYDHHETTAHTYLPSGHHQTPAKGQWTPEQHDRHVDTGAHLS